MGKHREEKEGGWRKGRKRMGEKKEKEGRT